MQFFSTDSSANLLLLKKIFFINSTQLTNTIAKIQPDSPIPLKKNLLVHSVVKIIKFQIQLIHNHIDGLILKKFNIGCHKNKMTDIVQIYHIRLFARSYLCISKCIVIGSK